MSADYYSKENRQHNNIYDMGLTFKRLGLFRDDLEMLKWNIRIIELFNCGVDTAF